MSKFFRDTVGAEKQDSYGGICLSMKRYCERKQVPLLPRPGDDSFVIDVTTLFYSFIGVALKKTR